MIRAFPDLYPDELMYSGYARYAQCVGYPNLKNIMRELFGTQQVIASVPFSSHLDYFVAHQPYAYRFTAESLISEHTLLPFFAPFLPPERIQQLKVDMRGANGPSIFMRTGLMASVVPFPLYLRYCPDCAREDERCFGKKYWHRHHQIPGVYICHVHKVWLENSHVQIHDRKTRHKFIVADEALRLLIAARPIDTSLLCETLLFIANGATWFLRQPALSPGLEFLRDAYRRALVNRDLAKPNGRIRMVELQEAFVSYYTDNTLSYLHCNLDRQIPDNWLARLVRKPDGSQHPLQHLLLMQFLGTPIEAFFSSPPDYLPFGAGPWPCLNAASNHYHQRQIADCEIVCSPYTRGRPVGTFSCSCGFVYSRTGPDSSAEDQFCFSKIRVFGQNWEMRLRTLWEDKSVSLRGIARQLNVDPLTVKRHASRLGLPFPRTKGKISELKENQRLHPRTLHIPETATLETYRAAWLTLLQADPTVGVKKLRNELPGVYIWLYRHDRIWLKEHRPAYVRKAKAHRPRVDWEARDIRLADEVKKAASRLDNHPGRPVRVTVSAIGREIGQMALLQQHLNKLPRTSGALEECVESRETYAVRRIWWTVRNCRQDNIYLERGQLIRRAGVARLMHHYEVNKAIDVVLKLMAK
ncbi:MAG TPA: TnsD family transposase [Ktedonobacteraceae bacterium]|nr:TnsD family transposase [Ktedonobacteraceae bacterium]